MMSQSFLWTALCAVVAFVCVELFNLNRVLEETIGAATSNETSISADKLRQGFFRFEQLFGEAEKVELVELMDAPVNDDVVVKDARRRSAPGDASRSTPSDGNKNKKNKNKKENPLRYYIIFSTSCSEQQDWESFVFFYHASKVKQRGNITRIASGCHSEQTRRLLKFHTKYVAPLASDGAAYDLHFTPDYTTMRLDHNRAHSPHMYMNKPFSVRHWMENKLKVPFGGISAPSKIPSSPDYSNDIVFLVDPDMILLRPLTHDFTDTAGMIWAFRKEDATKRWSHVHAGHPIAQQDHTMSSDWLTKLNLTHIVDRVGAGDNNSLSHITRLDPYYDAKVQFNAGPPYIATVSDMKMIVQKWTKYAPRVHDVYPKPLATMFGYAIASADLQMPHTMTKSLVVSNPMTEGMDGWDLIDAIPDYQVCRRLSKKEDLPFLLHYTECYWLGRWFVSKDKLPADFVTNCTAPLLMEPPHKCYKLSILYTSTIS